ncbi:hypothetical protein FQR65_LT17609 [Abscondita terminalis]|nr:hypothetical protein FQR65_LT17609 [Abscondita terminalis]
MEEFQKKIYVIANAENLNEAAANSLLKFLEEPTNNTYAILLSNDKSMIEKFFKTQKDLTLHWTQFCWLGTNHAIIPLVVSKYTNAQIDCVEIQKDSYLIGVENIKLNNLENSLKIFNEDMKEFIKSRNNYYDIVISNPPYFNIENYSKLSLKGESHQIARHEIEIDLNSLCRTAAVGCKQGGKFYMIHLTERLTEITSCLNENGFSVKKLKFIFSKPNSSSKKVLIESVYKGNKNTEVLEPLYIYDINGNYTKEVERTDSNVDQKIVEEICIKNNIKLEVLNLNKDYDQLEENFEQFARNVRYDFFIENIKKYNADGIVLGHNLNDHIETYIMQKKRNGIFGFYGIKEITKFIELLGGNTQVSGIDYYNGLTVIHIIVDGKTKYDLVLGQAQFDAAMSIPEFQSAINASGVGSIPGNNTLMNLIISLLPVMIIVVLYIYMFKSMGKGGAGMFGASKTRPRETKSDVKFSDIAGINEEKLELVELVDYLKNPNKYSQMGARIPKGVIMEGPPGTGKTLLAKAVAGEAGVAFYSMAGSEFEEMFVGLGASRVRDLFADAKKAAPCIIFIDEIDAVGRKRSSGVGQSTTEQTLNQLLVEMDGFGTNSGVIVMAATNRVDVLDSALLRPERTPGFSGAQLENVLNEAAILVVRNKKKMITLLDIDEAIDRVVGGPAKKSRAMTLQDKQVVSYHEAGHALIGLKLESASKVQKVTIIPRGNAGGYTIMTPKDESNFSSKQDLLAMIAGYMGGRAAEEIMFGKDKITTGAHDDLDKATNIARRMVTQFGMSSLGLTKYLTMQEESFGQTKGVYSDSVAAKIDTEIDLMLKNAYDQAIKIINLNKEELELIAESLRVLETITSEQIDYIDKNMKLPDEVIKEKERQKKHKEKVEKEEIVEFSPDED